MVNIIGSSTTSMPVTTSEVSKRFREGRLQRFDSGLALPILPMGRGTLSSAPSLRINTWSAGSSRSSPVQVRTRHRRLSAKTSCTVPSHNDSELPADLTKTLEPGSSGVAPIVELGTMLSPSSSAPKCTPPAPMTIRSPWAVTMLTLFPGSTSCTTPGFTNSLPYSSSVTNTLEPSSNVPLAPSTALARRCQPRRTQLATRRLAAVISSSVATRTLPKRCFASRAEALATPRLSARSTEDRAAPQKPSPCGGAAGAASGVVEPMAFSICGTQAFNVASLPASR
mmetsp:Transcript_47657/g.137176  ORF Transcript_47657/g.137176 Transcript_47657/m.137176 type:complete len:283 (-) Transcript_47657:419-1267(-)